MQGAGATPPPRDTKPQRARSTQRVSVRLGIVCRAIMHHRVPSANLLDILVAAVLADIAISRFMARYNSGEEAKGSMLSGAPRVSFGVITAPVPGIS